jgi:hypothetical protein
VTRLARPFIVTEQTAPATPPAGTTVIYVLADGLVYAKDDAGVVTQLSNVAGGTSDELKAWALA